MRSKGTATLTRAKGLRSDVEERDKGNCRTRRQETARVATATHEISSHFMQDTVEADQTDAAGGQMLWSLLQYYNGLQNSSLPYKT